MYLGLSKKQKKILEFEIISKNTRLNMARLFRRTTQHDDSDIEIIKKNRIINIARQVENLPLYKLESYDNYYEPAEKAWHFAEIELITRRPDTITFIEIICDLIDENLIDCSDVNDIFNKDGSNIYFISDKNEAAFEITNEIEDDDISSELPNIKRLIKRMDTLYNDEDFSGVLHSSASIFEVLAKDVISNPNIENKSLGSFFDSYKKRSSLSEPVLDMIKSIYIKRNTEPLAGHGQTAEPSITKEEAVIIIEMTKTFIRMERKFSEPTLIL